MISGIGDRHVSTYNRPESRTRASAAIDLGDYWSWRGRATVRETTSTSYQVMSGFILDDGSFKSTENLNNTELQDWTL